MEAGMTCTDGHLTVEGGGFCSRCGIAVGARSCPNGHQVAAEARFCSQCGSSTTVTEARASAPAASEQGASGEPRECPQGHGTWRSMTCGACGAGTRAFAQPLANSWVNAAGARCGKCSETLARGRAFLGKDPAGLAMPHGRNIACPRCGTINRDVHVGTRHEVAASPSPSQSPLTRVPPQSDRTNVWAILALVFGILGGILGIVFGFIAKSEIRRTGDRGDGMATAGIVLGFASIAMILLAMCSISY
ncbi:DUF4190 domain-containing protein [Xylanimonas ulmi]|uniref:DUF4190 domain-containing protein n=1 Tax=Xylanimonas ulmi TaxID=228973 RepID=UPI001A9176F6|nr:DUF4190 domain-containing protein [Xylanibacterium ulmi]